MRTSEQVAADNALEKAIDGCLKAYTRFPDGTTMVSYTVVAEGVALNAQGEVESNSHSVITNPGERLSVSKGNLHIGLDIIVQDDEML